MKADNTNEMCVLLLMKILWRKLMQYNESSINVCIIIII